MGYNSNNNDQLINEQRMRIWPLLVDAQVEFERLSKQSGNSVNYTDECKHFGQMMIHKDTVFKTSKLNNDVITNAFLKLAEWGLSAEKALSRVYFCHRGFVMRLGYRGVLELMHRQGNIKSVIYNLVHANDEFSMGKPNEPVHHRITSLSDVVRGEIDGGYIEIEYTDNTHEVVFLSKEELAAHLEQDGKNNFIYRSPYYKEMLKKAVIHRCYKHLESSFTQQQDGFSVATHVQNVLDNFDSPDANNFGEQANG